MEEQEGTLRGERTGVSSLYNSLLSREKTHPQDTGINSF
jgi:hypothetical protein